MRTLLAIMMGLSISGCGGYEALSEEGKRDLTTELVAATGGYRTPKFMALWSVVWINGGEVLLVPEIDGHDGGACISHDGSVMTVRRPVRELLLLAEGESCPWDYGVEAREEAE